MSGDSTKAAALSLATAEATATHADGPSGAPLELRVAVAAEPKATSAINKRSGKGRVSQPVGRGFSLMDWVRLTKRAKDLPGLAGEPPGQEYTLSEVKRHNTKHDAWMVVRGKIYNVSKYLPYHPGGSAELMRGVGRDATQLFDK